MLQFRQAGIEDIEIIRDLAFSIWPGTYIPIIGEIQVNYMLNLFYSRDALKEQMEIDGHKFLVVFKEGEPVGFSSVSSIEGSNVFKLHKLYLLPSEQGQGTGKALLQRTIDLVKELGGITLELNVNRNNPAIDFYKSQKFEIKKEEDISIGNDFFMNDYVMVRSL